MQKILFLTNMFPSKKYPSYGIFVEKTYKWLSSSYNIDLITICKSTNVLRKIVDYIRFYVVAIIRGVFNQYDCIYAHYISHCALPIKIIRFFHKNVVIVGNIHGEDVFSEYKKYQKNRKKATVFLKSCNYIIAPSEYFKNKLCVEYGFVKENVFVSPSGGVDTDLFIPLDKRECKEKVGLDVSKKYVGMVSRIEEGKGWDIFVQAASMITNEDVGFVIVGSGSQENQVDNLIKKEGMQEKITLLPMTGHDMLPLIYNSFDIFCFPTRRESESLGLVGVEAMSCKIPCIISNIPGPASYCNKENCLQFEPQDACQLRDKIIDLLNKNTNELQRMCDNARNMALEYDCQIVQKDFLKYFEKILRKVD